jgi:hypothetical protein
MTNQAVSRRIPVHLMPSRFFALGVLRLPSELGSGKEGFFQAGRRDEFANQSGLRLRRLDIPSVCPSRFWL